MPRASVQLKVFPTPGVVLKGVYSPWWPFTTPCCRCFPDLDCGYRCCSWVVWMVAEMMWFLSSLRSGLFLHSPVAHLSSFLLGLGDPSSFLSLIVALPETRKQPLLCWPLLWFLNREALRSISYSASPLFDFCLILLLYIFKSCMYQCCGPNAVSPQIHVCPMCWF